MEDQWTRSSEGNVGSLWVYRNPEYAIYLRHIPLHQNGMWVKRNIVGYRLLNDSLVVIHTVCVDVNSSPIAKYRYSNPSFDDIRQFARVIENRGDDSWCTKQSFLRDNAHYQREAAAHHLPIILIDDTYDVHLDLAQAQ